MQLSGEVKRTSPIFFSNVSPFQVFAVFHLMKVTAPIRVQVTWSDYRSKPVFFIQRFFLIFLMRTFACFRQRHEVTGSNYGVEWFDFLAEGC